MKQFLFSLALAVLTFGFIAPEAEAKRLGGGSSFGMKRSTPPAAVPQQNLSRPAAAPAPATAQPRRSWMGPIAGLAAGLGLAALFSHLGMGEDMANFVMILLLVMGAVMLFKFLFRRSQPQASHGMQYAGATHGGAQISPAPAAHASPSGVAHGASAAASDLDAEAFARQAKLNFIRLQTANDAGNLDDLREFTTPEVFAEISMQIAERKGVPQHTAVVDLNAEVIEVAEEDSRYIVSVRFSGLVREEDDAAPVALDEIWHLIKPVSGDSGWRVAGIQQRN
ncbi:Tim44 domain-containing protein [Azoarcus sp. L1K30]|uniref:Tim44 domain-containing protein n=1 Tax=Azoarcus sp. L1K30 TaxID=2820277 RepID=UPI001B839193|nr:TIM44-like domain-containing protein [Azoarcus sp. L1K30]MBR0567365.1 Tim44 domain-containing protein [Azoarcus sp. L1K30]